MEGTLKFGLRPAVIEKIQQVLVGYPVVEKAILYGSRARGNFREGSDIDLCLFGKDLDLAVQFKIENVLDELLLPYSIDVSLFQTIDNKSLT